VSLEHIRRRKDVPLLGRAPHRQDRRVFQKQYGIANLAGDPLGLELRLKSKGFRVVDSSEAAEEHGVP
jgi:hypothetical protein